MKIQTWKEFITQPIWFNKNITLGNKSLFFSEWFKKNILFISDLLDENGCYLNIIDLQNKYNTETNFLTFYGLQKSIKS